VLPYLYGPSLPLERIRANVLAFCADDEPPEFWDITRTTIGLCSARCRETGRSSQGLADVLPRHQAMGDQLGNPRLPKQESAEHNALNDARWNRNAFDFLSTRNSTEPSGTAVNQRLKIHERMHLAMRLRMAGLQRSDGNSRRKAGLSEMRPDWRLEFRGYNRSAQKVRTRSTPRLTKLQKKGNRLPLPT